jgi:FtsH-binding integral membrane protein
VLGELGRGLKKPALVRIWRLIPGWCCDMLFIRRAGTAQQQVRAQDDMTLSSILKIVVSWVIVGLLFGAGLLYLFKPLAGLTFLIIVMSGLMILVAPAVHVGLLWFQERRGIKNPLLVLLYMFVGVIVAFIVLVFSGFFDFA